MCLHQHSKHHITPLINPGNVMKVQSYHFGAHKSTSRNKWKGKRGVLDVLRELELNQTLWELRVERNSSLQHSGKR